MKFEHALKKMKEGAKMKLPSWSGYWCWDDRENTIMMHCKDGKILDIRETECVEYTLLNVVNDSWVEATEYNCSILGGEARMDFAEAIKYLKRGMKLQREGWNGKGMYIFLANNVEFHTEADIEEFVDKEVEVSDMIVLRTAQGTLQPGWLATQSDMLAEDWKFAD